MVILDKPSYSALIKLASLSSAPSIFIFFIFVLSLYR